ncbi:Rqc2 family fibronectin-binding protein [Thermoanaerobacterium thermosaccharolyticum]|uniref:Rqc2 family fibronectin-binding protein n=1 Tax=Thermoanaerobacterium thermosaccharolyticum TaxID=1517 RepID=UPI00177DB7B7|nr:NFACT RNA binding domain-containing protein [Thermoanaerobacterium thermosaccharolyticum]MBE0068330.1 fibronectin/fibrinogen-binding protein [Thermoanaerobacterium thermosaccharolyticum]MBE0228194.1 fibronectin/fibrinogen-binding protein [Thermoanaerobacterium thermosaccharolyticum]
MALDGMTLYGIICELRNKLLGGKIDKIYQPEKDEIIISIRNIGNNYKLLISANVNFPRIYLTDENKENPINPPMFCMLLRKYLQSGKIVNIYQRGFDRVVFIDVESRDELEKEVVKTLVVEIMGRYSNIILIDKESNIIVDSIKRVYQDMSKIREVVPGIRYELPPSQNKLNIQNFRKEDLTRALNLFNGKKVDKALLNLFEGFSPVLSREIAFRSQVDDKYINELSEDDISKIFYNLDILKSSLDDLNFKPCIAYIDDNPFEFSLIELTQYKNLTFYRSVNEAALKFYREKANAENIKSRSHDLKKLIQTHLDRLYNKVEKQLDELKNAENADIYRLYGELITSNLYKLNKKIDTLKTTNYYTGEEITIPLDIKYTPSENAQMYFKKYAKLKNAVEFLTKQIEETKKEIEYLEGQLLNVEQCTLPSEIDEIREELSDTGYIKKKNKDKKQKKSISKPLHYISSDNFDIYIGKNNVQNDYLTMKFADMNDMWLHTKNIPGSHVIIKSKDRSIPDSTILEAAKLAAMHSKAKNSSNVPVDYTLRKYVKKPAGSKPGFVIYTNQKTLYVTPDK